MRILDLFKGMPKNPFRNKELILDETEADQWPSQIVAHLDLDSDFKTFTADVGELTRRTTASLRKFTDEGVLQAIPDRARTMNALHGNEYATQVQKLLKSAVFTDIFSFERQQDTFFEASGAFKDQTSKNAAVLREFMSEELKVTQQLLKDLEDKVLNFAKTLEDKRFPQVRKLREMQLKIQQSDERVGKYQKLLESLAADLKRTQEKRLKLQEEIKQQEALVRNQESFAALGKITKIDEELHRLAAQYASICHDVRNVYKKHPDFELAQNIRYATDELPKDPLQFIPNNAETVKKAFEGIIAQFEEEQPGNTRTIIERLQRMAASVEQDCRRIQTAAPDQRALKREVMRDIAALNIYDKTQFLLRAQTEEEAINAKIRFLEAELDPNKRAMLQQEINGLAHGIGAIIKQASQEPTGNAEPTAAEVTAETSEQAVEPETK